MDPSPVPPGEETPGAATTSPEEAPPARDFSRIAYVSQDARIHTLNADGSDEEQVSPSEGIFTWPTWSPDATKIVYSGVLRDGAGGPKVGLFAYDSSTGIAEELHSGEPGFAGFLAEGVVHYPIWSPDRRKIAGHKVSERERR